MQSNMPHKNSQFKSVLTKHQENELIKDKLAHLKVKNAASQFVTIYNTRKGLFKCSKCKWVWASRHSFVVVDLVNLCLSDDAENKQGCRRCKYLVPMDQWPTPCFRSSWFKEMLDIVVTKYNTRKENKGQKSSSSNTRSQSQSLRPHLSNLCQKCIKSKKACWQRH